MLAVKAVEIGDSISWNGDSWDVLAYNGLSVQLRSCSTRKYVLVAWAEVIGSPDFGVLRAARPDDGFGRVAGNPLDGYSDKAQQEARDREAEIFVMRTGYRTRNPGPDECRDHSYDGLNQEDCQALLGKRLGIGSRQVRRVVPRYDDLGIVGLVDDRHERLAGGPWKIPPVLRAVINDVLDDLPSRSKLGNAQKRKLVAAKLDLLDDPPPLPAQRTFDRYLKKIGEFRGLHLSQKSQREAADRPIDSVPWATVNRPMQWVLLDSTPLDMFALDPMAEDRETKWLRVWLSIALDAYTRSIVGWVFTSKEPSAEDIALLLYRIATPKATSPDWPSHGQWRYPGVPKNVIFQAPHEEQVHA